MKFRRKPLVVEAIQYNGENGIDLSRWSDGLVARVDDDSPVLCPTAVGHVPVPLDHFIVRMGHELVIMSPKSFWAEHDVELPS